MTESWQPAYPRLAAAMSPELRALPEAEVARLVAEAMPGMTMSDAEDFFGDIGKSLSRAAGAVAPYLAPIAQGAVSGAATGSVAGPWGALIGAGLGALTSGVQAATGPRGGVPSAGGQTTGGPARPAAPAGLPGAGAPAAAGASPAIAQLLAVLGSPTVQAALTSMLMGRGGAPTAPTSGGGQVPVAAVTNMLASLAGRAGQEWEELVAPGAAPWLDGNAEAADEGSAEARAEALYGRVLPIAADGGISARPPAALRAEGDDEAWLDEVYDEFEAFLDGLDDSATDGDPWPYAEYGGSSDESGYDEVDDDWPSGRAVGSW